MAEPESIVGYAKIEGGAVAETMRARRRVPAGWLPIYRVIPGYAQHLEKPVFDHYDIQPDRVNAVYVIQPVADRLERWRAKRRRQVRALGLEKIREIYPTLNSLDAVRLERDRWLSILVAARAPNARYQRMLDTGQAALAAISAIRAETDIAVLLAYNPETDPGWP